LKERGRKSPSEKIRNRRCSTRRRGPHGTAISTRKKEKREGGDMHLTSNAKEKRRKREK